MPEYQFANHDGSIISEDYDGANYFTSNQVLHTLQEAFNLFPYSVQIERIENLEDVFHVIYPNGDGLNEIFICAKGTTPGGRSGLKDEQRIQPKAKFLNYVYDRKQEGKVGVFLGVYSRDGQTVLCTWKVNPSNAASPDTPISKQIKINSIAKAMQEGFVQYDKGQGEYACAFKPAFLYFYLRNCDWLHTGTVNELAEHTPPETEDAISYKQQKEKFRTWMTSQVKENGQPYSHNTISTYIGQMERGYAKFEPYKDYTDVFQIQLVPELKEYTDYLFNAPGFAEFNDRAGNKACSCGFVKYKQFLEVKDTFSAELCYETSLQNSLPRNRIIFGAPGTGKSYTINKERAELLGEDNETDYERVTFHPDYSYANFVGTYKPVPCKDSDDKDAITYEYVPGPFMRVYVNALKNGRTGSPKPFLLIIEEINRADVAAVFGDMFQLLDRGDNDVSEYPIEASEDIKKYLSKELAGEPDEYSKICLPNNMFIWATMNSADQGVFPMDTAFKRRWNFTYIGIDDSEENLKGKYVLLGKGRNKHCVEWNKLRKAINRFLAVNGINEDKQLGPYFIAEKIVVPKDGEEIKSDEFIATFKNKVLMYLFEDAAKQKRSSLIAEGSARYSEICRDFDEKGVYVFCSDIVNWAEIKKIDEPDSTISQEDAFAEENDR